MRLGATHPALGPRQGCQRWAQSSPERWIVLDGRILCEDDFVSRVRERDAPLKRE